MSDETLQLFFNHNNQRWVVLGTFIYDSTLGWFFSSFLQPTRPVTYIQAKVAILFQMSFFSSGMFWVWGLFVTSGELLNPWELYFHLSLATFHHWELVLWGLQGLGPNFSKKDSQHMCKNSEEKTQGLPNLIRGVNWRFHSSLLFQADLQDAIRSSICIGRFLLFKKKKDGHLLVLFLSRIKLNLALIYKVLEKNPTLPMG